MLDLSILNAKRSMVFVFQKTIKYSFEFRTELARVTYRYVHPESRTNKKKYDLGENL